MFILLYRFFAPQLINPDINSKDLLNICSILTELEDHVLSIVQKMMKHLAQVCHYFIINSLWKESWGIPKMECPRNFEIIFCLLTFFQQWGSNTL